MPETTPSHEIPTHEIATHEIPTPSRREFLQGLAAAGALAALPAAADAAPGGRRRGLPEESTLPCLVRSLPHEHRYRPRVSGRIPEALRGTLYRNGPGIFERDGFRKRCLLDGDGMVQAFHFDDAGVEYANRFVGTEKFHEEEAAGRFLYQSWTTVAPGGWLANLGIGEFKPSAGVHVVPWCDGLYALEDASHPYRLDPESLATEGADRFGLDGAVFNAHSRIDPIRRQWIHVGVPVAQKKLHVTILDAQCRVVSHRRFALDRGGYVHDCFATASKIVVVMSPVAISPMGLLMGRNSVAGCFRWKGDQPNHVYVIDRDGGDEIVRIDAPAMWSWHTANAFDRGDEIVLDCVGYDEPDHFIGEDPYFWAIMEGRFVPARHPGSARRHIVDPQRRTLREEVIHAGSLEFPVTNPEHQCHPYRYAYYAGLHDLSRGLLHDRVVRVDMRTGRSREYALGQGRHCGESVFVPKPGVRYDADALDEPGWLLTLVYDLDEQRSELEILEAEAIEDGPVATVQLEHATPFSFHGSWRQA